MMIAPTYELESGRARASRAASGASPEALRVAESDGDAPSQAREARALPSSSSTRYARHRLPHFERPWTKYAIAFSTEKRVVLEPSERDLVMQSLLLGRQRLQYELYTACVMPDHVHLLLEPQVRRNDEKGAAVFWSLGKILHGIRSGSAHRINKLRQSFGRVWEEDYFDRYIRSESDLHEKFHYICQNPWSSEVVQSDEDYPWLWTPESQGSEPSSPGRACASRAASGASPDALRA
jgi:putative transposase